MKSQKRELKAAAQCPCESGKKYGQCCKKQDFKWVKDSSGKIYRVIPIHPELAEVLKEQRKRFKKIFGREPGPDDPVIPQTHSAKEVTEGFVEAMIRAEISPECIYAYLKTGLIVSEFNLKLIPKKDLEEWNAAIKEFREAIDKEGPAQSVENPWFAKFELLLDEADACEIFFRQIIQKHGIALNIKNKLKPNPLHDFIFFCVTKSLKTFEAINRLLETTHGEDALILTRSMYESYLTINFLIARPENINSFVSAEVGRKDGTCNLIREPSGKRVIIDQKTGERFEVFSTAKMAKSSPHKEDIRIYNFFYGYLSEFSHPSIWALEAYLDGYRFDPGNRSKIIQARIYSIFCAVLVLDKMTASKKLNRRFRADLCAFLRRVKIKLAEVFDGMTGDSQHPHIPQVFKQRASGIGLLCGKRN